MLLFKNLNPQILKTSKPQILKSSKPQNLKKLITILLFKIVIKIWKYVLHDLII